METENTTTESKIKAAMGSYFEKAIEGQEKMTEAFETATKRSFRMSEEITGAIVAGQRDLVEFSKSVAAEPDAYAKNIDAFMNLMIGAQQRSIEVSKNIIREQTDAAGEMKDAFEPVVASAKEMREKMGEFNWMKPLAS
ncbi:MAG: hypothetical protein AAF384_12895 [Pseudomonadota bacterium]